MAATKTNVLIGLGRFEAKNITSPDESIFIFNYYFAAF
jgi:hypothetical protein